MAGFDSPQLITLAERIAALNQQKNFQSPPPITVKRAPPPPPPNQPAKTSAQNSPCVPPCPNRTATENTCALSRSTTGALDGSVDLTAIDGTLPPPLPSRDSQQLISPGLPPRRPSNQTFRDSASSDDSHIPTVSSLETLGRMPSSITGRSTETTSARKLPPALGKTKLPPIRPTRREIEAKARESGNQETPAAIRAEAPKPSLPPRLPSRPARLTTQIQQHKDVTPVLATCKLPPLLSDYHAPPKSALTLGFAADNSPPVPTSLRPSSAQIRAALHRTSIPPSAASSCPSNAPNGACLLCRDFSGPDTAASRYPIHSLPRVDPEDYLARVLGDPFPSHTDKARAIFTWCHHNIVYDVENFFAKTVPRGQTPSQMIYSGKAVCEGYARIYEAIAIRAGLLCTLVSGHGKGYGFRAVGAGQPSPPRDPKGHAWNAVRIDGGVWKLVDPCWGAGHLDDKQTYVQRFSPKMFTMSNEQFGERHYPRDGAHFYRGDGRQVPWEEYILGSALQGAEPVEFYDFAADQGLDETKIMPRQRQLSPYGGDMVRFQLGKVCEHWTHERNGLGKPYLLLLKIHGVDGLKEDLVPLDCDGFWSWIDVPARHLGVPGQRILLYAMDTLNGKDARGLSKVEFLKVKGHCGFSLHGMAAWDLV